MANASTEIGDLPEAGVDATSDFYPQLERGMALGGAIGVIGGLLVMRVAGGVIGGGAVPLLGLIGAGINGLLAAMAGAAFPSSRLAQFESAVEAGHVLVMVDMPVQEIADIAALVRERRPEVEIVTLEPVRR